MECGLVEHAKHELDLIAKKAKEEGPEAYRMQLVFNNTILDVIRAFANGEHSGFTASIAIQYIDRLLKYQPLTELSLSDDEWSEYEPGKFQNKRCCSVFKDSERFDGEPFCIDGPEGKFVKLSEYPRAYLGDYTKEGDK